MNNRLRKLSLITIGALSGIALLYIIITCTMWNPNITEWYGPVIFSMVWFGGAAGGVLGWAASQIDE
jgi:hypothetical protein